MQLSFKFRSSVHCTRHLIPAPKGSTQDSEDGTPLHSFFWSLSTYTTICWSLKSIGKWHSMHDVFVFLLDSNLNGHTKPEKLELSQDTAATEIHLLKVNTQILTAVLKSHFTTKSLKLQRTVISFIHSIGMCRMQRLPAILRSFSVPLCYISFPSTLFHQLVFHPHSLHPAIYFLVYFSALLLPNSYIILFWEFYCLPFSVHAQTSVIYLTLLSLL